MEMNYFKVRRLQKESCRLEKLLQNRCEMTIKCYNIVARTTRVEPMQDSVSLLRQENTMLREENARVREENARFREENAKLHKLLITRDELKASGPHKYFYKDGQTDSPYCPKCWQKDGRQVLLPASAKFAEGVGRQCTVCDKLYVEEPAKPLPPAIAIANPTPRQRLFR